MGSTDPAILRLLQDVVASAPRMPAVQFNQMFNSQVQGTLTPTLALALALALTLTLTLTLELAGAGHACGRLPREPHTHTARSRREAAVGGTLQRRPMRGGRACIPCEERPCCGFSLWRGGGV